MEDPLKNMLLTFFASPIQMESDITGFNETELLDNGTDNDSRFLEPFYLVLSDMGSNWFCNLAFAYTCSLS